MQQLLTARGSTCQTVPVTRMYRRTRLVPLGAAWKARKFRFPVATKQVKRVAYEFPGFSSCGVVLVLTGAHLTFCLPRCLCLIPELVFYFIVYWYDYWYRYALTIKLINPQYRHCMHNMLCSILQKSCADPMKNYESDPHKTVTPTLRWPDNGQQALSFCDSLEVTDQIGYSWGIQHSDHEH